MIERNNIKISTISWIHRGGIASNYYEPESVEELITIYTMVANSGESYNVIGHTSNIYFKNSYCVDNLISTKSLTEWSLNDGIIKCMCGVSVSRLAKAMVADGINGFEGLIDLPGTVGGAIYGNAGCYNCSLSELLIKAEILTPDGTVNVLNRDELLFSPRNSILKRGLMKGVILNVYLKALAGDAAELVRRMENIKIHRRQTQPAPYNNLGTTYFNLGERTLFGLIVEKIGGGISLLIKCMGVRVNRLKKLRLRVELSFAGARSVSPYLFSLNRFIWKDANADAEFVKYQKTLTRLFKKPSLEIEIFE